MYDCSATASTSIPALSQLQHHRLSNSSSVVTVKRPASLSSGPGPRPSTAPYPPQSPGEAAEGGSRSPKVQRTRRRSSVAHVAVDGINGIKEGVGNLNRWSHSSTSSRSSSKDTQQSGFSRRLSFSGASSYTSLHGSTIPQSSPPRETLTNSRRTPPASPHKRPQPHSPVPHTSRTVATSPPVSSLPTLPRTVYDPSPASTATAISPSTGLYTPGSLSTGLSDYFSARPYGTAAPTNGRSRVAVKGKQSISSLGSPFAVDLERQPTAKETSRTSTPSEPAAQPLRTPQKSSRSHQHSRQSSSRGIVPQHRDRSDSDKSARIDDEYTFTPPRKTERRERDKKTMLSRALQKANTAVLLDNAQNFEGAMEAYGDACKLLQQVMKRSSEEGDRRKLEAIRVTYTSRIQELRLLDLSYQSASGKSLPARPMSNESLDTESQSILSEGMDEDGEQAIIEMATMTRIVNDTSIEPETEPSLSDVTRAPHQRESVLTSAFREVESTMPRSSRKSFHLRLPSDKVRHGDGIAERLLSVDLPMDKSYMPPPLSPRRPISPSPASLQETSGSEPTQAGAEQETRENHMTLDSGESMSWLAPIGESDSSSCASSVHSVSPPNEIHRKHVRVKSGDTEAEFDAALDAAVEAAYDDGFEPFEPEDEPSREADPVSIALKSGELAKERIREVEREEVIRAARDHERERLLRNEALPLVRDSTDLGYNNSEAEEEERVLDEMTKEYKLGGFDFGLQSKTALPRESDASSFSSRTWNSSVSSNRTTAANTLSTVAEAPDISCPQLTSHPTVAGASAGSLPQAAKRNTLSLHPPPSWALPKVPSSSSIRSSSVRSRRMSGQNPKQLMIETSRSPPPIRRAPLSQNNVPTQATTAKPDIVAPKTAGAALTGSQTLPDTALKLPMAPAPQSGSLQVSTPLPSLSPAETTVTVSPATAGLAKVASNESNPPPDSPGASRFRLGGTTLRKNKSSLSLKQQALSISSPDGSEGSLSTPMSMSFSTFAGAGHAARRAVTPSIPPTPTFPNLIRDASIAVDAPGTGSLSLFESEMIHSPSSPRSPHHPPGPDAPIPLEPCPETYLLRPFWLMRALYQTIAHPKGGYLSTKLFVPRDVWRVKGVKLKSVDEKVANCDLLTAALLKLGRVDTLDADAVLEEMQALEVVLDQAQASLGKKLGSDVGVNGVQALFRDAPAGIGEGAQGGEGGAAVAAGQKSNSAHHGKSYLSSWRKLRSKNSGAGLSTSFSSSKDLPKDALTMATLPMTALPNVRFAKREVSQVEVGGPNANYMGALVRLFDAVQVVDQIARQVEDPGLKLSSPTHVGLELCTRHASEFFGFYVCRFVLGDLMVLLDKFIKRGSEWVMV